MVDQDPNSIQKKDPDSFDYSFPMMVAKKILFGTSLILVTLYGAHKFSEVFGGDSITVGFRDSDGNPNTMYYNPSSHNLFVKKGEPNCGEPGFNHHTDGFTLYINGEPAINQVRDIAISKDALFSSSYGNGLRRTSMVDGERETVSFGENKPYEAIAVGGNVIAAGRPFAVDVYEQDSLNLFTTIPFSESWALDEFVGVNVTPDGEKVIYFDKSQMQLVVANTSDGQPVHAIDFAFEGSNVLSSKGAVSPTGEKFAFGTYQGFTDANGQYHYSMEVNVVDIHTGEVKSIPVPHQVQDLVFLDEGESLYFMGGATATIYSVDQDTGEVSEVLAHDLQRAVFLSCSS